MIIKIFNTSERTGKRCINYLLGRQFDREGASVISGLPVLTALIIDSSRYKKSYISGVISVKGQQVDERRINEIKSCFQLLACAGLSEHQINFLWVRHTDKNHSELNFVIPCVDLESGKNINFLDKKYDHYFLTRFQDFFDVLHGYDSPLDPVNRRSLILNEKVPAASKVVLRRLHGFAMRDIESGVITSREDLYELYKFYGYEVTCIKSSSITVADIDSKRKYKFAGFVYEEDFDFSSGCYEKLMVESRAFHLSRPVRLAEARQALIFSLKRRASRQARYVNSQTDDILYDRAVQLIDDFYVAEFHSTESDLAITADDKVGGISPVDRLTSDTVLWEKFDDLDDESIESEEPYDYGP